MKPIVFPKLAINKIAPPAFEVQPPADVASREEVMQRKASAMHEINTNDVAEFLQKVAAEDRWKKDFTSPAEKKKIQSQNRFDANYSPRLNGTLTYEQNTRGEGYGPQGVLETVKYPASFHGKKVYRVDKNTLAPTEYQPVNWPTIPRHPDLEEVTTHPYYNVP